MEPAQVMVRMYRERGSPRGVSALDFGVACARAWRQADQPKDEKTVARLFLDVWQAMNNKEKANGS